MSKITELLKKYKELIMYLVFGVLTTLVNIGAYYIFAHPFELNTVLSTVLAWAVSVLFAFFTNKFFVFESKKSSLFGFLKEIFLFFTARLSTGLLDVFIMFIFVDKLAINDMLIKIVSNIIVIVLNYVLSKLFVFRGKNK